MKNIYYPLASAPMDDDYLYQLDYERERESRRRHEDDYEDEIPSDEYDPEHPYWLADGYDPTTDPLRIIHTADREARKTA